MYAEDCYDFVEYAAYDQMLYYSLTYSYDMIPNPYLMVEGNKISIDPHTLVKYSSNFPSHTKKEWYSNPKLKVDLEKKPPPLDQYIYMTPIQVNVLIKLLYVNVQD
jgi:hypothetical protein